MGTQYWLWDGNQKYDQEFIIESSEKNTIRIQLKGAGGKRNTDFLDSLESLFKRLYEFDFEVINIQYNAKSEQARNIEESEKKIKTKWPEDFKKLDPHGFRKKVTGRLKEISGSATSSIFVDVIDSASDSNIKKSLVRLRFIPIMLEDFIEFDNTEREDPSGFVYLLTNVCFPNWVKIGKTFDPSSRLFVYLTGDPHRAYQMEDEIPVKDMHQEEKDLHSHFEKISRSRDHEWFEIDLDTALNEFNKFGS